MEQKFLILLIVGVVAGVCVTTVVVTSVMLTRSDEVTGDEGPQLTVYTNPGDGTLARVQSSDSTTVVLGERNSEGAVSQLTEIQDTSADGTAVVKLEDGRIGQALTASGMRFTFRWTEATIDLTVLTPDGSFQLDTQLPNPVGAGSLMRYRRQAGLPRSTTSDTHANLVVRVDSCSPPDFVSASLTPVGHSGAIEVSAKEDPLARNVYLLKVPLPLNVTRPPPTDTNDACTTFVNSLGLTCNMTLNHQLPVQVCDALPTLIGSDVSEELSEQTRAGCYEAFGVIRRLCVYVGVNINATVATQQICDAATRYDPFVGTLYEVVAFAYWGDGKRKVYGVTQLVDLKDKNLEPFIIKDPSDQKSLELSTLEFYPRNPRPRQDYVANITLTCAQSSAKTNMSITGTDGYTDITQCQGEGTCTLLVPGAEKLVRDTVVVEVTDGETSKRRDGLVIFDGKKFKLGKKGKGKGSKGSKESKESKEKKG